MVLTLKERVVHPYTLPFAYFQDEGYTYGVKFNAKAGHRVILREIRVDDISHNIHPTGGCDCGLIIDVCS